MFKALKKPQTIAIIGVILLALVVVPSAHSSPSGISYQTVKDQGCYCHSADASADVVPSLVGLPTDDSGNYFFNASETYTLEVSFTGGPSGTDPGATALGGFNLWASAGTLAAIDDSLVKLNSDGSLSHSGATTPDTDSGNDQTNWTVQWTAPDSGGAKFVLHTNSVNGDHKASGEDQWNKIEITIGEQPLEQARGLVVLGSAILLMVVVTASCLLWVFYRRDPDAFTWDNFWPWISDWLTSTDHKKVGTLYFINGLFFLGIGGMFALIFRIQLASPGNDFLTTDEYNQFFTMHGTVMIFLAAMPMIAGLGNWIVPLQIGAHDLALPRLNALAFWLNPAAALLIFSGIFSGQAADVGWTGYAPYVVSHTAHSGATMWVAGQILLVASSTIAGVNFMTTFATMRAPGMGWMQMPLFSWSIFISVLMLFISIPAFGIGLIQVFLDRTIGTTFYEVAAGGDPLLWSHLFWYFGHPEVYVVVVPAFGIISEVIATSARRTVFGYKSMVFALAGIGILGFIVYGHHMFTSGMDPTLRFVTMLTTMLVAVPTGIKVFNWLQTMHGGSLIYRTHTLWALGFLVTFTLGGISGMYFPSIAMDLHLHETYFVVAHFHYVFVGGIVFGIYSGIYYWFPKATGRMLDERLGILHFITGFISYNMIFWPMHRLGIWGMPRRQHTYFLTTDMYEALPPEAADWNMMITIAAFCFFASNLILVYNMISSSLRGAKAPDNPWGGWSMEWMVSSPPPTPSHDPDNPPVLDMSLHEHDEEPGFFGRMLERMMISDEEEVSY
ncbi:MAG: cbb3-type cytochrome c oxidase subunit I [Candidatus Thermoplasmatota archaeon]|nr:cbb3-type cytochrome c oxidase subunit I [Candidatus Thermoplasmatota archaeon]